MRCFLFFFGNVDGVDMVLRFFDNYFYLWFGVGFWFEEFVFNIGLVEFDIFVVWCRVLCRFWGIGIENFVGVGELLGFFVVVLINVKIFWVVVWIIIIVNFIWCMFVFKLVVCKVMVGYWVEKKCILIVMDGWFWECMCFMSCLCR